MSSLALIALAAGIMLPLVNAGHSTIDSCAVTLQVNDWTGQPVVGTDVELLDPNGATVARTEVVDGRSSFCDFGFGPHSIVVGVNECMPVIIRNVRVVWGTTQKLTAVMNECKHFAGGAFGRGCILSFRVVTTEKKPMRATMRVDGRPQEWPTSALGRIEIGQDQNRSTKYVFSAAGYESRTVENRCEHIGLYEREIELRRQQR